MSDKQPAPIVQLLRARLCRLHHLAGEAAVEIREFHESRHALAKAAATLACIEAAAPELEEYLASCVPKEPPPPAPSVGGVSLAERQEAARLKRRAKNLLAGAKK